MDYVNNQITLDMHSVLSQVSISAPQNDTWRRISATLTEGGKTYRIPDGCRAVFSGIKADGTLLLNDCIIERNTVIRYDFTPQTTAAIGRVDCTIKLYGEDGGILSTPRLTLVVYEGTGADITLSEDEKNAIDALFLAENARVAAENARVESEEDRAEAENARSTAEGLRVTAEEGRASAEGLRADAESGRASAETVRVKSEEARVEAENSRGTAEEKRASAESGRVTAEEARALAERSRATAESGRVTAENSRAANEAARETLRAELEKLRHDLQELVDVLPEGVAELPDLMDRVNAVLDSDDETLDELSEIVAYIKSNKSLIEAITTSKVNVADIVDNLLTPDSKKPLSANQGVALKKMIDDTAQTFTATIPLSWVEDTENGGYTQAVAVDGILATDNPIADIVLGADVDANALYLEAWACVTRITTADGSITLYANEGAPGTAFTVQMKVVR